jgi:hypothetical protein
LIAELELVSKILGLVKELPMRGESLSFHDSFIERDSMCVELVDRLYILFNTKSKRHAAERIYSNGYACLFNERMITMYYMYESSLSTGEDNLIHM